MRLTLSTLPFLKNDAATSQNWREKVLPLAALTAILLLAASLRFMNLDSLGYVNHYYAAAVKSMLQSWHNFFFVAAEPGGAVSVDKPPVGLWLQAISAYFFGVNSFGLLFPQILAGLLSIIVVFHLVRRTFGSVAGLVAALALAITPVVVATDRNNTIDSTLILTLLLAAWAFIKATETSRLRYLLLGAALVGVAFNIKMLAAYLPVPAFFALYFLGAREGLWRKVGKLALTGMVLLALSFSWAIAVDLTPADQRPYVGSSSDNSVMTLILGYNGVNRLLGMNPGGNRPADGGRPAANNQPSNPAQGGPGFRPNAPMPGNLPQGNGLPNNGQTPPQPPANGQSFGNRPQGGGGPGGFNIGQAGFLRLFIPPLSKEVSWLFPFGLVSLALLIAGTRLQWPLAPKHQALVLWGGWLLIGGVFFSVASFFHEYYLSLLGAPLAALVGIGVVELWSLRKERPLFALILLLAGAAATLGFQMYTAQSFVSTLEWLPLTFQLFLAGAMLLIVATRKAAARNLALAGFTLIVISIFITPAVWSRYTALSAGSNLSLPAAYSGGDSNPTNRGNAQVNQGLLNYLQANTQDTTYLLAVPSSMQGADYVLATGRPVLYMGGFNGNDQVVSATDLQQMVQDHELRYIYIGGGRGLGSQAEISSWVTSACTPVQGFDTATRNFGAPDGTATGSATPASGPGGLQAITLYDCEPQG